MKSTVRPRGFFSRRVNRSSSSRPRASRPDRRLSWAARQYALRSTSRREEELRTNVVLERRLTDLVLLSARWSYTNNRSTADVFDYDRHVIGAYLTVGFGS